MSMSKNTSINSSGALVPSTYGSRASVILAPHINKSADELLAFVEEKTKKRILQDSSDYLENTLLARLALTKISISNSVSSLYSDERTHRAKALWEKSLWHLFSPELSSELEEAKENPHLRSKALKIRRSLQHLKKARDAYVTRNFERAAKQAIKAVVKSEPGSIEQERARFMWKLYAKELCMEDRLRHLDRARETAPELHSEICEVADYQAPEIKSAQQRCTMACSPTTEGKDSRPLWKRLMRRANATTPRPTQ